MKTLFPILLFFATISAALAQVNTDSVGHKIDSLGYRLDSLGNKIDSFNQKISSIPTGLPQLPDSLLPAYNKVNAIRHEFNEKADSLKNEYQTAISKIDKQTHKINNTIDSLEHLKLPTGKYTGKLDSLNQIRQKKTAEITSKVDALKAKTTGKLKGLDLPPQYNEPLQQLTSKDGFGLNSDFVKIPQLEIPGFSVPKIDGIGDLSSKVPQVGNLGSLKSGLPKIETPVGDLGNITDQVGKVGEQVKGVSGDIKSISEGNLNDVQQLPKTLEQQAAKIDGVQELQKQSGVIDEYKGQLDALKDPNAAKEMAVEKAKEVAIDHFAGKEAELKAAMDKISKYKQKYSSVSSLKDLPKRPPNAMKGKPFIERLVPGLYFQYQQKNYNLFDFNPYLGYRISGRFTAGAGWNQRYPWDRKKHEWNYRARIFGPRAYVDFKLGKGFIAHMETEVMNTFVPSVIQGNPDTGQREWVWGMMTGMKKEYKIYKNLKGTVLLQYNIFNPKYKAPYVDRLNSRIGFEYVLKKKPKKTSSQ